MKHTIFDFNCNMMEGLCQPMENVNGRVVSSIIATAHFVAGLRGQFQLFIVNFSCLLLDSAETMHMESIITTMSVTAGLPMKFP